MRIVKVSEENIAEAGKVHSESWKESHRSFCSTDFVERHSPEAQTDYLRAEIAEGKSIFMLLDDEPVGIVSVHGELIENLYVLSSAQRRGYGSRLLEHALKLCSGSAKLWILNTNLAAFSLYSKYGFRFTGVKKPLKNGMYEAEMELSENMGAGYEA